MVGPFRFIALACALMLGAGACSSIDISSANGLIWDVQGPGAFDDGAIGLGSIRIDDEELASIASSVTTPDEVRAWIEEQGGIEAITSSTRTSALIGSAFLHYGALAMRVRTLAGADLGSSDWLAGFDLTRRTPRAAGSDSAVGVGGVSVWRSIFSASGSDWLRYLDCFSNTNALDVTATVVFGGGLGILGSWDDTTVAGTSSGDLTLNRSDNWTVTVGNGDFDVRGPAESPPIGHVLGTNAATRRDPVRSPFISGLMAAVPFEEAWTGNGDPFLGHRFEFVIPAGQDRCLMNFLVRGTLEGESTAGNEGGSSVAAPGSQIQLVRTTAVNLTRQPNYSGISTYHRQRIVNWASAGRA